MKKQALSLISQRTSFVGIKSTICYRAFAKAVKYLAQKIKMELYISNIPFTATNEDLEKVCAQFGAITRINVVRDKNSGRSKGFAFVEFPDRTNGEAAIAGLNGIQFMGRELKAREAMPKRE